MKDYKFLIVEDEYITAMEIKEKLSILGYKKANIVTNAKEAEDKIKENSHDVYLLDITLNSENSSFDLVDTIKTYSKPNIIFISAYSDQNTLKKANEIESYGFLRKPFDEKDFYLTVQIALNKIKEEPRSVKEKLERLKEITPVAIIATSLNGITNVNLDMDYDAKESLSNKLKDMLVDSVPMDSLIQKKGIGEYVIIIRGIYLFKLEKIVDKIYEKFNNDFRNRSGISLSLGNAEKKDNTETIFDAYKRANLRLKKNKLRSPFSEIESVLNVIVETMTKKTNEPALQYKKMPALSYILGKELGLSNYETDDLFLASRVHNVGKIAVKGVMLNKNAFLTRKESEEIIKYFHTGYKIIDSFRQPSDISKYILHHHERWDGSGYPNGLTGEEIPYISRIIAVVDAYDTLTMGMGIKKASHKKAINVLKKKRGTQFDPKIIDALSNIDNIDIEKVIENFYQIQINGYRANCRLRILKQSSRFDSIKALCEHFNISRTVYYNWKNNYEKNGEVGLAQTKRKNKPQKEKIIPQKKGNSYLKNILNERKGSNEGLGTSNLNNIINKYYRENK